MDREKQLFIGVLRRLNHLCSPWDLEISDSKDNYYWSDENKHFKRIRKLNKKDFKKELNRQLDGIKLWRRETKKDRGKEDFIGYFIN